MSDNFNRLSTEKSPYLLQHQDNPVHWFAWGKEAFEAAKAQQKPIFLSIGYSTCYWCHVMEKESFERTEVARVLNRGFISIKVDREERPDIDQVYMEAVQVLTGHGGWPLTALLSPDLKPFFGCTYLPRQQLLALLESAEDAWKNRREDLAASAQSIVQTLSAPLAQKPLSSLTAEALQTAYSDLYYRFDKQHGGFGAAPKFPAAESLALLLRLSRRSSNEHALEMVNLSLHKMACGGIFDQLGGGFHRYSTDEHWLTPHFEKMLYDNALLAHLYLEAFQHSKNEAYSSVAEKVLDYVLREMQNEQGGFFAAQDAGEVGKEGEFYVWPEAELKSLLSHDEFLAAQRIFQITAQGNFENSTNILHRESLPAGTEEPSSELLNAQEKLLAARSKRPGPHKDNKIITAWNGLMISALSKGYQVLANQTYLIAAQKAAGFIQEAMQQDGRLLRRFCDGEAKFLGCLDDYAYLIQALLDLYESDFNLSWLNWAQSLQTLLDQFFWSSENKGYFYSEAEDARVLSRKIDWFDGATPSGNGVSALNLLRLYHFTFEPAYKTRAE